MTLVTYVASQFFMEMIIYSGYSVVYFLML